MLRLLNVTGLACAFALVGFWIWSAASGHTSLHWQQTYFALIKSGELWLGIENRSMPMTGSDRRALVNHVDDMVDQMCASRPFKRVDRDMTITVFLKSGAPPQWQDQTSIHFVHVPLWWISATMIGGSILCFFPWTAKRVRSVIRLRAGRCNVCGYDLRGHAERCPECGSVR